MRHSKLTLSILLLLLSPATAHAFCGFFVSGGGAELFNDATIVVLMRDGLRTVLSMQNNYRGPAEDFAMVVPVPVVVDSHQSPMNRLKSSSSSSPVSATSRIPQGTTRRTQRR